MSTRAVYTFIDSSNKFHIYKHHDGYPSGAAQWIENALSKAWALPRFEADEFAAAFIAANKSGSGGVSLTDSIGSHSDLAFRYKISFKNEDLFIRAFKIRYTWEPERESFRKLIFRGTFTDFKEWAKSHYILRGEN